MKRWAFLSMASLSLFGCGGSGNTTHTPLTNTLAQIQANWTWSYNFTGTFTPTGGGALSATGTRTDTCTSSATGAITETEDISILANGVTYSHTTLWNYTQGADGSLLLTSFEVDASPTETVQTTAFAQPGTLTATTSAKGLTTFTDGTTQNQSFQVSGIGTSITPVADFAVWQVTDAVSYPTGTSLNVVEDWVPAIGHPVQISGTGGVSDGSYTGTFLMQSTNVPLPN